MKIRKTNKFKQALSKGEQQVGFWLSMGSSYSAEMCASVGFQWLLIDGEHAPNNLQSMLLQLQAIAPYSSHPVVRLADDNPTFIKQILDIGAQTLLIPMVQSAEQAEAIVKSTRYPPFGTRGVGAAAARASLWNGVAEYVHHANQDICLLVQVESVVALENIEAICAVEGVDGVFIGPSDLAASMGHVGDPNHPEVKLAIEESIQKIIASGKAAGTLTSDSLQAKKYMESGVRFVAVGLDVSLMMQAVRKRAEEFEFGQPAMLSNQSVY